ncbi:50S ribosomal protein L37e [archaeon]|nr:50S ribosomal protein L37e [archaeon]
MSKGTPAQGKRTKTLHIRCRRCGSNSFHKKQKVCSSCGFGKSKKLRNYSWQNKKHGKRLL